MNMLKGFYLWLGSLLFNKPFFESATKVHASPWKPEKGMPYWSASIDWVGQPSSYVRRFDEYDVAHYCSGKTPQMFASDEHAIECSKRMFKTARDYHEELGY